MKIINTILTFLLIIAVIFCLIVVIASCINEISFGEQIVEWFCSKETLSEINVENIIEPVT